MKFTGRSEQISATLPEDLVSYLRLRAKQEDRSFSKVLRRVLEDGIMAQAAARDGTLIDTGSRHIVDRTLVDTRADYTIGGNDA